LPPDLDVPVAIARQAVYMGDPEIREVNHSIWTAFGARRAIFLSGTNIWPLCYR
jgi:hypothetical protein